MLLLGPPVVYRPQSDSQLLRDVVLHVPLPRGARVLDLCTGTGLLALTAARKGASQVHAVDVSPSAVLAARCNAWLRRLPVRVQRGDVLAAPPAGRYDLVTANPPYVPCPKHAADSSRRARAWDAGEDGRRYLDRLCAMAPDLLAAAGVLLVVHSSLCGPEVTVGMLRASGLSTSLVGRRRQPLGPVLRSRAQWLETRGLLAPGEREEELVVIRADRA